MRIAIWILGAAVVGAVGFGAGSVLATQFDSNVGTSDVVASATVGAAYDCPAGSQLSEYPTGSRVFAVAQTKDGGWIQVRDLDAPGLRAWMRASSLDGDSDLGSLPVSDCETSGMIVAASTTTTTDPDSSTSSSSSSTSEPSTTTSTSGASTTTSTPGETTTTTSPPETTTTTVDTSTSSSTSTSSVPPDTTPPNMSSPSVDENKIWEDDTQGLTCGALPRESVITVTVTDAQSGVNQVRASWTIEGQSGGVTLSPSGSTYAGTFGSFPYLTIPDNTDQIIPIIVTATDNAGNETKDSTAVRLHSTATCFG